MHNDNNEKPSSWPLLPSHSAAALHGICLALADTIREEGSDISRRGAMKMSGLATATELLAGELAHFFFSRMGDDHDQLEAIADRYLKEND